MSQSFLESQLADIHALILSQLPTSDVIKLGKLSKKLNKDVRSYQPSLSMIAKEFFSVYLKKYYPHFYDSLLKEFGLVKIDDKNFLNIESWNEILAEIDDSLKFSNAEFSVISDLFLVCKS